MIFTAVIEKLKPFSEQEQVPDVIGHLTELMTLPEASISSAVEHLRTQLVSLLSKVDIKKDGISLAKIAHEALLTLATFAPLNTEDFFTLDPISPEDSVFISTGHQFSLTQLIHYHNNRPVHIGEDETVEQKWLLNPITNNKFNGEDERHILAVAAERGILVLHLKAVAPLAAAPADNNSLFAAAASAPTSFIRYLIDLLPIEEPLFESLIAPQGYRYVDTSALFQQAITPFETQIRHGFFRARSPSPDDKTAAPEHDKAPPKP